MYSVGWLIVSIVGTTWWPVLPLQYIVAMSVSLITIDVQCSMADSFHCKLILVARVAWLPALIPNASLARQFFFTVVRLIVVNIRWSVLHIQPMFYWQALCGATRWPVLPLRYIISKSVGLITISIQYPMANGNSLHDERACQHLAGHIHCINLLPAS